MVRDISIRILGVVIGSAKDYSIQDFNDVQYCDVGYYNEAFEMFKFNLHYGIFYCYDQDQIDSNKLGTKLKKFVIKRD